MTLAGFPSFRGIGAVFAGAVLASAILLLPGPLQNHLHVAGVAVLAGLIFQSLRGARFSLAYAVAITLLTFAQGGMFLSALGEGGSIRLALAVFVVAVSAGRFCAAQDARGVILLGGALCLAQWLDPLGVVLSMMLLPLCAGLPRAGEMRARAGLFALLLFMPLMMAVMLAYLRLVVGIDLRAAGQVVVLPVWLVLTIGFVSAPVLWVTFLLREVRHEAGLLALYTGLAVLVAVSVAALFAMGRDPASIMAAMGAGSAAALCGWRRVRLRAELALAATALGAVLSWIVLGAL